MYMWTQAHASFIFGYVVIAAFILDDMLRSDRRAAAGRLAALAVVSLLVSCIGPFSWHTVLRPFEYLLVSRNELIYQSIGELAPINWNVHRLDGLPLLMLAWPVFAIWRWRVLGYDAAELGIVSVALVLAMNSQRFLGVFSLVVFLYLARDISQCLIRSSVSSPARLSRNLGVGAACIMIGLPTWTSPLERVALGWEWARYPVGACDFIAAHNIRGHSYNYFWLSGYILHRFWPDRDRLPFMDIHQFGTPEDRELHTSAQYDHEAWLRLDKKHRFAYAVLTQDNRAQLTTPDFVEHDASWAMVFNDDAGIVYVRRDEFPEVTRRYAYEVLRGSDFAMGKVIARCATDTILRRRLWNEGLRQLTEATRGSRARLLLGVLAAMNNELSTANAYLLDALRVDPLAPRVREKLGILSLAQGNIGAAETYFREEYRVQQWPSGYDFRMGQVHAARGNHEAARRAYERELRKFPNSGEARDSLAALMAR